ncbi:MAG: ROK family protein [Acidobacteriia bacterium]|nr:ROK family protein [Terriglobia bacterium]
MPNTQEVIVGIDMGGTSVRALVVSPANEILAVEKTATNPAAKPERIIADLAALVEDVLRAGSVKRQQLRAVSIGCPGAVDPVHGIVYHAPNLGWEKVALGPKLGKLLRTPVLVENDVNVGVTGEYALGAGQGAQELVGIFVGTGIGGGIISGGRLYQGARGAAGEVGHMIVQIDGPRCGCGNHGCIEALASRTALERDVRAAIRDGHKSMVLKLMKERGKDRMTSSIIQRALKKHDPVMLKVMKRAQYYLGVMVSNVVNLLDPDCVVIGGGIAERLGEEYVAPIRKTAYEHFLRRHDAERVKIVPGILGDNAGPLGAAVLARRRLERES